MEVGEWFKIGKHTGETRATDNWSASSYCRIIGDRRQVQGISRM